MMKKISRLALLAAATAFLLAAFPACSDNDDDDPTETGTPATAKTYNFVSLSASDFKDESGNAVSAWGMSKDGAGSTWKASDAVNLPGGFTTVAGATVYCEKQTGDNKNKQVLIRARTGTDSKSTALNYNGGATTDISDGIAIADLDRYIKIHVDGAGTVSASIKIKGSSKVTEGTLQIAFVDGDGNCIGNLVTADIPTGKIAGTDSDSGTVTGTVTTATDVYLVLSRCNENTTGGGMDVTQIAVTPAAN
ncbi:MAG: hypothetical protein K2I74_06045 [Treponemataceae bacterium]|nr:hypothetical protein [Treponemataceae bacterium]